jgi:hypothetical protein
MSSDALKFPSRGSAVKIAMSKSARDTSRGAPMFFNDGCNGNRQL